VGASALPRPPDCHCLVARQRQPDCHRLALVGCRLQKRMTIGLRALAALVVLGCTTGGAPAARCEPAAYLERGAWRKLPPGPLALPPRCVPDPAAELTPMDYTAARYACNDSAPDAPANPPPRPRFEWHAERPCAQRPWARLFRPNRTVWIVGDSMSMQTALVLHCSLAGAVPAGVDTRWRAPAWTSLIPRSRRDVHNKRTSVCAHLGADGQRLCFLVAGTASAPTVADVLQLAIAHGQARAHDLALVNSGAWQMGRVSGDAYQRRMVAALIRLSRHADCPRLFWRESYAQHFPTPDGVFTRKSGFNSLVNCTSLPTVQPPVLAEIAAQLRAQAHIHVLPTWRLTQGVPAAHRGNGDCSHYCNWVGVLQATLDAFAHADVDGAEGGHSHSTSDHTRRRRLGALEAMNSIQARTVLRVAGPLGAP